jgi:hypothetical protein
MSRHTSQLFEGRFERFADRNVIVDNNTIVVACI